MKIDWANGWWNVWDIPTGAKIGSYRSVRLQGVAAELTNVDGNRHGWLIVKGMLTATGEHAVITGD